MEESLKLKALTDDKCVVSWDKVPGATRYAVSKRKVLDGKKSPTTLVSDSLDDESVILTGLVEEQPYEFEFAAGTSNLLQSNTICFDCRPLSPVDDFKALYVSSSSIVVQWRTPKSFQVQLKIRTSSEPEELPGEFSLRSPQRREMRST